MILIIDAYNVIKRGMAERVRRASLADARDALLELLAEGGHRVHGRLVAVFDGYASDRKLPREELQRDLVAHAPHEQRAGVDIYYSAPGSSADDAIMTLVQLYREHEVGEEVFVVSDDRPLISQAVLVGANSIPIARLLEVLQGRRSTLW